MERKVVKGRIRIQTCLMGQRSLIVGGGEGNGEGKAVLDDSILPRPANAFVPTPQSRDLCVHSSLPRAPDSPSS